MKLSVMMLTALIPFGYHAQITNPAPYCAAQYFTNYNMFERITVNGATQEFGAEGIWSAESTYLYYNNYTIPAVHPGEVVNVALDPYAVGDMEPVYFALFIDWNNNNAFETSEIVMQNSTTTHAALPTFNEPEVTINHQFTVPANAVAGSHRARLMREGMGDPTYSAAYVIDACVDENQFGYGCTFDFDITVAASSAGLQETEKPVLLQTNSQISMDVNLKQLSLIGLNGSVLRNTNASVLLIDDIPSGVYLVLAETNEGRIFSYKVQR